jgi:pantoate--beta-alanine ligase
VQPKFAVFGEKDFQQLVFIKDLAIKRNPVVEIISVPTVREKDGLAMSSRNIYLSSDQRNVAHLIPEALRNATLLASKGFSQTQVKDEVKDYLKKTDLIELEYIEIVNNELHELTNNEVGRILIAAKLGNTRLIDNMPIMFKANV